MAKRDAGERGRFIGQAMIKIAEKGAPKVVEEALEQALTYFSDNGGREAYSWYDEVEAGLVALAEIQEKLEEQERKIDLARTVARLGGILLANIEGRA